MRRLLRIFVFRVEPLPAVRCKKVKSALRRPGTESMQRQSFLISTLLLAALVAGYAPNAAQVEEASALEAPTPTGEPDVTLPESALSAQPGTVPDEPSASCPVTGPQNPRFIPPSLYSPDAPWENYFWFGSPSLWAMLPSDGIWRGSIHKVFWWRDGYVWNEEPQPALTVTAERLDAAVPPVIVSRATNAYAGDIGSAMLVGVDFPTGGCWKITGQYKGAELGFVVWVTP